VGGAEANVAVGLAHLGRSCAIVSAVPDNALGHGAVAAIRSHGVDCTAVQLRAGRMGLYFLSVGSGLRASEIIYDRAASSFAQARAGDFDWDQLLKGARLLHLSGITPALGAASAEAALSAARAAKRLRVPVSFDGNYRALLWQAWDSNPRQIMAEVFGLADILFGNHRDIALVLDREFIGNTSDRRRAAADAAFVAFPGLQIIASTARAIETATCHRISARVDLRSTAFETPDLQVSEIVDRIGAGDAFAAGVLHAHLRGDDAAGMARTGLALTCLKHSLPGDASLFAQRAIDDFLTGGLDVRR
jgi:2-dehydro-3-deoxygluconokinase